MSKLLRLFGRHLDTKLDNCRMIAECVIPLYMHHRARNKGSDRIDDQASVPRLRELSNKTLQEPELARPSRQNTISGISPPRDRETDGSCRVYITNLSHFAGLDMRDEPDGSFFPLLDEPPARDAIRYIKATTARQRMIVASCQLSATSDSTGGGGKGAVSVRHDLRGSGITDH